MSSLLGNSSLFVVPPLSFRRIPSNLPPKRGNTNSKNRCFLPSRAKVAFVVGAASFWLRRLGETIVSERHAGRTPKRGGAIFGNGMGAREWIRSFQDSPSGSASDSPVSAVPSLFMRPQPIRLHRRDVTGTQRKPCFVALLIHRSGESSETEK